MKLFTRNKVLRAAGSLLALSA
ncbi:DUF2155 domain-containing protein, partial [Rhizobium leguminosarum]